MDTMAWPGGLWPEFHPSLRESRETESSNFPSNSSRNPVTFSWPSTGCSSWMGCFIKEWSAFLKMIFQSHKWLEIPKASHSRHLRSGSHQEILQIWSRNLISVVSSPGRAGVPALTASRRAELQTSLILAENLFSGQIQRDQPGLFEILGVMLWSMWLAMYVCMFWVH